MERNANPFLTIGYTSKAYFCDREDELEILHKNVKNGIHTSLISARRLGKTALIYRLFEELEQDNYACIYADIYACRTPITRKSFVTTFLQEGKKRSVLSK